MTSRKTKKNTNRTRSQKNSWRTRKATTVESLHASFDKIANKVKSLIQKGSTDSDLACCVRNSWSEQFHTGLSPTALKGMVIHYRAVYDSDKKGKSGRKTRKSQRGGMAPFDWTMGQGTTDHVYGRFPVEMGTSHQVVKALDNSRFVENRGGRSCDTTGGHGPQMGGGVFDAIAMGHAPGSIPRNYIEGAVSSLQGAPIVDPNSSPVRESITLAAHAPRAYDANTLSNISSLTHIYKGY